MRDMYDPQMENWEVGVAKSQNLGGQMECTSVEILDRESRSLKQLFTGL